MLTVGEPPSAPYEAHYCEETKDSLFSVFLSQQVPPAPLTRVD